MALSLLDLPRDVFMTDLLPLIDPFSLCRLFQVSKSLNALVTDYITINKVINMEQVERRFNQQVNKSIKAVIRQYYSQAFKFLTNEATGLRQLNYGPNHAFPPLVAQADLQKVI